MANSRQDHRISFRSNSKTVVGSSLLWAWGFLSYLSPSLFPVEGNPSASTGLEYGFFASQAAVLVFAAVVLVASKRHHLSFGKWAFFGAALLITLTTVGLSWALRVGSLGVIVACGVVDGFCVSLMGVAWGARYSLGSSTMRPLVVVSFLVAYLLYLVVAHAPHEISFVVVCLLPVCSWAFWISDATARHELSSEVFAAKSSDEAMPGELMAGSWEARVLPWRSIRVLIVAAFIGNLMASVVMGWAYDEVESLFYGGIVVCACIATMALVPLTSDRNVLSVDSVYRITVTFTAVGLVAIMVFGAFGVPAGGALVQGSAFFLQALVFLVITQSTQEQGLSPLLSFSVGQALIAAVVFAGNVLGKQVYALFGSGTFVLDIVCGCGLLGLFFMMVARASAKNPQQHKGRGQLSAYCDERELPSGAKAFGEDFRAQSIDMPINRQQEGLGVNDDSLHTNQESLMQQKVELFAQTYALTKRETEVFGYLARGRSLPYIAEILFVTTGTVKTHTVHIYRKLQVNSRQELLDMFEASQGSEPDSALERSGYAL